MRADLELDDWTGDRPRARARVRDGAVPVAVFAGLLQACGGVLPVVAGGAPGFGSAPLLVLLAVAPAVVAVVLRWLRRSRTAAGVLAGVAALAPGRLVLDLQLAFDASMASRPALYAPDSLASPAPAIGLWLLLAGQAAWIVAGSLALRGLDAGRDYPAASGQRDPDAGPGGRPLSLTAMCAAALVALGLLMAPFTSTDPYLLERAAFGGSGFVLIGKLLLAGAVPLVVALVLTAGSLEATRGCLAGAGLGVLGVAVPELAAAASMTELGISAGPVIAAVGAAGLLALGYARSAEWAE